MLVDVSRSIAAIASPPGHAARGVVRLSGPQILDSLQRCFRPSDPANQLASIRRPTVVGGFLIVGPPLPDICVDLAVWPTTKSYTRQPCAEIHCIGAPPILDAILQALSHAGIRQAEPGEFTLRAFLAGRIDLTQAEAVVGVIDARSRAEMEIALRQLSGGLAGPIETLRDGLLNLLAEIEAGLDFVEDDIEFVSQDRINALLSDASQQLDNLLTEIKFRQSHQRVLRVVLYGRPNVGKSCLLNALSVSQKSLVSDIEGTTRDYVTGLIHKNGLTLELVDTAGLDESASVPDQSSPGPQTIQQKAQSVSEEKTESAHLRLLCLDGSRSLDDWERRQIRPDSPHLFIQTKADLSTKWNSPYCYAVSAVTGGGIESLRQLIFNRFESSDIQNGQWVGATATRCHEGLIRAAADLRAAIDFAVGGSGDEVVAAQIRGALDELAIITGRVYTDDILDRIFSQFCIGK